MILDSLKTARSKEDLAAASAVVREFKACESDQEYLAAEQVCRLNEESQDG